MSGDRFEIVCFYSLKNKKTLDIKWLMFDADNTLLDFKKACEDGLRKTFVDFGSHCTPEIETLYESINADVWHSFEEGEINALQVRRLRFARLFDALDISPADPLEFNAQYLENLVYCSEPYEGLEVILTALKPKYHISLITNGLKEVQRPRLARLGLNNYFDSIIVSDEIGVAKPDAAFFEYAYGTIPHRLDKHEVMVIGDNIKADIGGGKNFGFKTCWISHGKNNTTDIEPDFEIHGIHKFQEVLASLK